MKEYGSLIYSFFTGTGKKYYIGENDKTYADGSTIPEGEAYQKELYNAFINYAISFAKSHKNTKFVLEGIWLFLFIDPNKIKDYTVYIKGASKIKSKMRAMKRDFKEKINNKGPDEDGKKRSNLEYLYNYIIADDWDKHEPKLNQYRKYFKNLQKNKK